MPSYTPKVKNLKTANAMSIFFLILVSIFFYLHAVLHTQKMEPGDLVLELDTPFPLRHYRPLHSTSTFYRTFSCGLSGGAQRRVLLYYQSEKMKRKQYFFTRSRNRTYNRHVYSHTLVFLRQDNYYFEIIQHIKKRNQMYYL